MSDDELANDRTFLAWLRTSIAVVGLGFVVAKVALIVQPNNKTASSEGLYAAVGIVIGLVRWRHRRGGLPPAQDRAGRPENRRGEATTPLATHHHGHHRCALVPTFRADHRVDVDAQYQRAP